MLELLRIQYISSDTLMLLALCIIGIGAVIGYITDSVMGERGFGPIGNGMLVILGAFVGIYIRHAFFRDMDPGDVAITGIFAAASATLLLMLLGLVKHWVQD